MCRTRSGTWSSARRATRCTPTTETSAHRHALRRVALILARPLEELEDVAVRVAEEDLNVTVAPRHRAAFQRDAVLGETRAGSIDVIDLERQVMRHPLGCAGPGIGLSRTARRVSL